MNAGGPARHMPAAMIEVCDLTKCFGRVRAVDHVSFSIGAGEIVGLLGPNGSGKTTLMRVLTGYFPPTGGSATVGGCDVRLDSLGARRRLGYVPEHVVLYPDLPVRRFLMFAAEVKGVDPRGQRTRIADVMHTCGLEEMSSRLIGRLSRGYRQRVAIAQALLTDPPVLILDEPTVSLDPRQTVEIRSLIRQLGGKRTVLLSTHILPEVSLLCGRVVIIDQGRVVAEDTAARLARRLEISTRTLVRVGAPVDEVATALRSLARVQRVERCSEGQGRYGAGAGTPDELIVTSSGGESDRSAIAAHVVGHGWPLLELRAIEIGLEELFLRVLDAEGEKHKDA